MALYQIPKVEKYIGFKVCRNIRSAFVNIGKYLNGIHNYEAYMIYSPYHKTGVNSLLCYFVLGDAEKVSRV